MNISANTVTSLIVFLAPVFMETLGQTPIPTPRQATVTPSCQTMLG